MRGDLGDSVWVVLALATTHFLLREGYPGQLLQSSVATDVAERNPALRAPPHLGSVGAVVTQDVALGTLPDLARQSSQQFAKETQVGRFSF